MYTALLHIHSGMRYLILIFLVLAVLKSIWGWKQKLNYRKYDNFLAFSSMLFIHLQLVFGFVLYFLSPRVMIADISIAMTNPALRYYTVEHLIMMLIVVALVTIGRIASKKKLLDYQKFKTIFIYYGIALLLIWVAVYVMMPM